MIRDLVPVHGGFRSRALSKFAACALIAWATACAPSAATLTQSTVGATACASQDLVVFNYDRKARTWLAACNERVFVCSPVGNGARCAEQAPDRIDPALAERVAVLATVPAPQRDLFVHYDVSSQSWDAFALLVATVARLRPAQASEVEDPKRLYTAFSPEFDAALAQCLGADGVARVDVANSGSLSVQPNKPCLMALRGTADLGALRTRWGETFYLATGVRGIEPVARPSAPEPEEAPVASPLEVLVREWLDGAAPDILTCTSGDRLAVSVEVAADGAVSLSLQDELAGSPTEGCVRSALPDKTFEGGPLELIHLVRRKPVEAPEEATDGEDPAPPAQEPSAPPVGPSAAN